MIAIVPWTVDVPMNRWPWANCALLAVTVLVSLAGFYDDRLYFYLGGFEPPEILLEHPEIKNLRNAVTGERISLLEIAPVGRSTWYLPTPVLALTSTLLHGGIVHLAGNMLFLWVFGNAVNYKLGHVGYLTLYFVAALYSGLAQFAASPLPAIGASGAIMGIVGLFLVLFPRNNVEMVFWIFWFKESIGHIASFWMILIWVAWDLCFFLLRLPTNVGVVAHLSGFVFGFLVGIALVVSNRIRPTRYEETLIDVLRKAR